MLLEIDDWRTVGDLQYRFNKCFTNLHLQLFAPEAKIGVAPLAASYSLEQIRKLHRPGVLSIKSWFTCREVAQLLSEHFGLNARVVKLAEGREIWQPQFAQCTLHDLNESVKVKAHQPRMALNEEDNYELWR